MPTPTLSRVLAVSATVAGLTLAGLVPVSAASAAPASGKIVITEWMYNSAASNGDGEFAEFTNTGSAPVDLNGWSYDDSDRGVGTVSLSSLGTIQPDESFLLTDIAPAAFRTNWGLPDSVKVLQHTVDKLGNGDEINIWDGDGVLQDRLTYPSDKKTSGVSAWVPQADLGAGMGASDSSTSPTSNATNATSSVVGDASGSWTAADGSIGSPGLSQFGSNFRFVRINEVTSSGNDTVELTNTSSLPIDVTGWKYVDDGSGDAPKVFTSGLSATTIAAHGYVTFDKTTLSGAYGLGGDDGVHIFLPDGTTAVDDVDWPDGGADTSYARCPDGLGAFATIATASFGSSNQAACDAQTGGGGDAGNPTGTDWKNIKINEVDSDSDTVELVNTGANAVDVSTWKATDSDSGHSPTMITPSAASVPGHGYVTFHSPFGLSADGDAVRLFLPDGTTPVDSTTWTSGQAEPGSYARCPDSSGPFIHVTTASFGSDNTVSCQTPFVAPPGDGGSVPCDTEAPTGTGPAIAGGVAWPGSQTWNTSDNQCEFVTSLSGQDISGLVFDPANPNVLYAAKNKSHVYRLVKSGGLWVPDTTNGWATGKDIVFPSGLGNGALGQPDDEAITVGGDGALYVTSERDNTNNNVPLDTVLRFDPTAAGTVLTPTASWNLTSDLGLNPATDANLGFEGITYVPDSALTSLGFVDQNTHLAYDPATYADHGSGLYFVAVEKTGHILAYALSAGGVIHRVADIATGMPAIAETQWDPDTQRLWAIADNTSSGSTEFLKVDAAGAFAVDRVYDRPTGLPNYNLEGFAIAPNSTCVDGEKEVVRSDDGDNGGHSLWSGTIDCDLGLDVAVSIPTDTVAAGGTLTLTATGLTPGNDYVVILHSTPAVVGSGTAGASGTMSFTVTIPADTTPGAHTIGIANAANPDTLFATAALTVDPAAAVSGLAMTGVTAQPFVELAAILALLGVGLTVTSQARRRRRVR